MDTINYGMLSQTMTEIRKIDQIHPDPVIIDRAASVIKNGGTVVFPTETVYGLGADATTDSSVMKIYKAKGRPPDNPLIVHFSSLEMMRKYVHVTPDIERFASNVWPGPVTFILEATANLSIVARASLPTAGSRIPANPVALALIDRAGVPISAPSANISTRPSIVSSAEAIVELDGKVDMILDAGMTFFGMESTVLRQIEGGYEILRPGAVGVEDLEPILGKIFVSAAARAAETVDKPITPGMKYRHYSPGKTLYRIEDRGAFISYVAENNTADMGIICSDEVASSAGLQCISLGTEKDLYEIAKNLFPAFRKLDSGPYKSGIIHGFPESGIGLAIMNRIRKASVPYQ
ncbi:MAG: L-threonylcarbamoyladenylate synthase [Candidatus Thermoplasmatota archaeon]|nr:L-threonylcarbamoyladenylate synthase [Candidatus Thermoplasmatota archaeon]